MKLVDEPLMDDFRQSWRCEMCRKPTPAGCDPCHLLSRGAGRVDIRENLIACCRKCHNQMHADPKALAMAFEIVAARESTTVEKIRELVWAVRRAT